MYQELTSNFSKLQRNISSLRESEINAFKSLTPNRQRAIRLRSFGFIRREIGSIMKNNANGESLTKNQVLYLLKTSWPYLGTHDPKLLKAIVKEADPKAYKEELEKMGMVEIKDEVFKPVESKIIILTTLGIPSHEAEKVVEINARSIRQRLHKNIFNKLGVTNAIELRKVVIEHCRDLIQSETSKRGLLFIYPNIYNLIESQIMTLAAQGKGPQEICSILKINYGALRQRLSSSIFNKLGVWDFEEMIKVVKGYLQINHT